MKKTRKRILGIAVVTLLIAVALMGIGAVAADDTGDEDNQLAGDENTKTKITTVKGLTNFLNGTTGTTEGYLANNITGLTSTLTVNGTKTLDLKGFVIQNLGGSSVITISAGANLILNDTGATTSHYFNNSSTTTGLWEWAGAEATNGDHTVTGGCITGGSGSDGGGIYIKYDESTKTPGTLTMNGGNIVGNTANYGGGVSDKGTFTMSGGAIKGNVDKGDKGGGGGVRIATNGKFTMTGGDITTNTPTTEGGGVRFISAAISMTVGGTAKIFGNTANGVDNNVYLVTDKTMTIGSALTGNACIGVSMGTKGEFVTTGGTATNMYYFTSDDKAYAMVLNGNKLELSNSADVAKVGTTNYPSLRAAIAAQTADGGTITLLKNTVEDITITKNLTLDLNGNVLKGTGSGSVVTINKGSELTLMDSNSTTVHYFSSTASPWVWNPGISAETSGYTAVNGGCITGGNSTFGGGINILSDTTTGGTLTMKGGNIVGNTAQRGGGVGVGSVSTITDDKSKFNMTGGCIEGNYATSTGGGVHVRGAMTVGGTAVIKDNKLNSDINNLYVPRITAETMHTIAVVGDGSTPLTSGADIGVTTAIKPSGDSAVSFTSNYVDGSENYIHSDNDNCSVAEVKNGGNSTLALISSTCVCVKKTDTEKAYYTTLQGAVESVSNNDAIIKMIANSTENVTVDNKTLTLDLNGYVLKAKDRGCVVEVNNGGKLTLIDSNEGNQTHYFTVDNGLWTWNNDTSTTLYAVTGGCITGGTGKSVQSDASHNGGGIYVINENSTLTMNGGTIVGNKALKGGGVFISKSGPATFTMTGGSIKGNRVEIYDTTASGNHNAQGGGVRVEGSFIMTGGSITDNTAVYTECAEKSDSPGISGGGVAVYREYGDSSAYKGKMTIGGSAEIKNNKAEHTKGSTSDDNVYLTTYANPITVNNGFTGKIGVTLIKNPNDTNFVITENCEKDYRVNSQITSDEGYMVIDTVTDSNHVLSLGNACKIVNGSETTYYKTLAAGINNATSGATITVLNDCNLTEDATVVADDTLDLNGKTVTIDAGETLTNSGTVKLNGTLTNMGTFNNISGTVEVSTQDALDKAINASSGVVSNGKVKITDTSITLKDNSTVAEELTLEIPNEIILTVPDTKTLTVNGTLELISVDKSKPGLDSGGTVNNNGTIIVNNEVDLDNAVTFDPSSPSGDDTNIATVQLGSGIALGDSLNIATGKTVTLDLNGMTLNGASGFSVITADGNLTLTDTSTGGKVTGGSKGVYVVNGTLAISGNAAITGNTGSNLYLPSGKTFSLQTGFNGSVGVTTEVTPYAGYPVTITSNYVDGAESKITSDNSAYSVQKSGDHLVLSSSTLKTFTVTFDVQGHGTVPQEQHITEGQCATEPANPVAVGYIFDGWYTEASCKNLYDFDTPVTSNFTLYAKWIEGGAITISTNTVNFGTVEIDEGIYTVPAAKPVTITNSTVADVGIDAGTPEAFIITGLPTTLASGDAVTFTIQPKSDLTETGDYSHVITVVPSNAVETSQDMNILVSFTLMEKVTPGKEEETIVPVAPSVETIVNESEETVYVIVDTTINNVEITEGTSELKTIKVTAIDNGNVTLVITDVLITQTSSSVTAELTETSVIKAKYDPLTADYEPAVGGSESCTVETEITNPDAGLMTLSGEYDTDVASAVSKKGVEPVLMVTGKNDSTSTADINVEKTTVTFTVESAKIEGKYLYIVHVSGTKTELIEPETITYHDDKADVTASYDRGFSSYVLAVSATDPTISRSSSSVTSFFGEKDGSDFTFDRAVVITKMTLPGASYATVVNTSGSGWYNCTLSTDGTAGVAYFQVPLDVIDIKGYTVNDVSLIDSVTTYLGTDGQYAKYSAPVTGSGAYTIGFVKGAATTAVEKVQEAVEQKQTATEQKQAAAEKVQDVVEQKQTTTQTAAKTPVGIFAVLAGLGAAGFVAVRRR